jgi:hypothetical protein
MSFHGAPRHFELAGNFGVVTALQQQFDDLLFAWTEPHGRLLHSILPFFVGWATLGHVCWATSPQGVAGNSQFS